MTGHRHIPLLAALATAAACAPSVPHVPVPATTECVVVDDDARPRIVFGLAADTGPRGSYDPVTRPLIHETLVRVDCTDRAIAGVAVAWSSIDGREWRFRIRQGSSFGDGTPVNAHTVAAGLATRPMLAGVAATAEYDLHVVLHDSADVRLFAYRELAVQRPEAAGTPPGTGAYLPLLDQRGRVLQLISRSAREGSAEDAHAGAPDTIDVRTFGDDLRTAIDAGVDALVANDAATIAYARARSGYGVAPLTWSMTYVLATADGGDPVAPVPAAAFPETVVGAASRPALPPFWWDECHPEGGPPVDSAPRGDAAARDRTAEAGTGSRILFLRDDPVARAIAERITALARGRAPLWLADRLSYDRAPTAAGVSATDLAKAVADGTALAIVASLRRVNHGGCRASRVEGYAPLRMRWRLTPLVDTRDHLVYRPGIGRVTVDADGTLRFGGR